MPRHSVEGRCARAMEAGKGDAVRFVWISLSLAVHDARMNVYWLKRWQGVRWGPLRAAGPKVSLEKPHGTRFPFLRASESLEKDAQEATRLESYCSSKASQWVGFLVVLSGVHFVRHTRLFTASESEGI